MAEGTDHYATLGISPSATPTQIKAAYRRRAKAAHPDAGGNVETMARVNQAYKVLGDPAARRAYDGLSDPRPVDLHHQQTTAPPSSEAHPEADLINRQRTAWARQSAWEMARLSAPLAIVAVPVMRFIASHLATQDGRTAAGLLAFVPVYALILSLVFLFDPLLRLVFADLVRHHRTTRHERLSALGVVLSFFPLAALWIILFY